MTAVIVTEIDVDRVVDEKHGIMLIGKARMAADGRWRCLANVHGMLCIVEVTVTPAVKFVGEA
jgi:hypothetical protein